MGNKLNLIKKANLLLEQRFLQEQNTTTGSTQNTGTTQTTTVPPQKPQTTQTPQLTPNQKIELEKIKKMSDYDLKSKYLKCTSTAEGIVLDLGTNKPKIHKLKDSFCIG